MRGGRSYWFFHGAVPMDPSVPLGQWRGEPVSAPTSKARRKSKTALQEQGRKPRIIKDLGRAERKAFNRRFDPPPVDVAALRQRIGMSRTRFAHHIGVPVATLRHWERGDRKPRGAALVLLNLIARNPQSALRALWPRATLSPDC